MNKILLVVLYILLASSSSLVYGQQPNSIDSLKIALKISEDLAKANTLYLLFREYAQKDLDSANKYVELAIDESLGIGDSLVILKSYYGRGWLARRAQNFKKAIEDLEFALEIGKRNDFSVWKMHVLNELALIHSALANYDKALEYNFQSLEIREETEDPIEIGIGLTNVGIVYLSLHDYENGIKYFKSSYDLKIDHNVKYDLDLDLINIGVCYNGLGRTNEAIQSFNDALRLCGNECSARRLAVLYSGFGESYLLSGNYEAAGKYLRLSIQLAQISGYTKFESLSFHYLAKVYLKRSDFDNAMKYANRSYDLVKLTDFKDEILLNYQVFVELYALQNNYKKAYEFQTRLIDLNKEIFGSDRMNNIIGIQSDYEERKRQKIITAKNDIIILKENAIAQQRVITIISVVLMVLLVLVALMLWYAIRTKGRINHILNNRVKERTRELNLRNDELNRLALEQSTILEKLNQQVRAFTVTLSGLMHVAEKDVQDPLAIAYLRKLDKEISKMKNKTSLFLKPRAVTNKISPKEELSA
ncbi:MAG: tetratricopeptide repeat protein [Cyclobacteriaceae bacterium]|nr:tetratricopeptide repeat protein [Cyclobacteriaceae bacterium]